VPVESHPRPDCPIRARLAFHLSGVRCPRAPSEARVGGSRLRGILVHPSLAGLRSYEGEIVAKGSWPAILDEVTSARLRLLFADPTRRHLLPSASGTPEPSNPTPTARGRARPPPSAALPLARPLRSTARARAECRPRVAARDEVRKRPQVMGCEFTCATGTSPTWADSLRH